MSRPPSVHPVLALAAFFAACGPGACERPVTVEVCRSGTDADTCEAPPDGFAAGLGYELRAEGRELPSELALVVSELDEGRNASEVGRVAAEVPEGEHRLTRRILFPTVGRYRVEVRGPDDVVLGSRDVEVTIATSRPGTP